MNVHEAHRQNAQKMKPHKAIEALWGFLVLFLNMLDEIIPWDELVRTFQL